MTVGRQKEREWSKDSCSFSLLNIKEYNRVWRLKETECGDWLLHSQQTLDSRGKKGRVEAA